MFKLTSGSFRQIEEVFVSDLLAQRQKDPLSSLLVLSPSGHLLDHLQRLIALKESFLNVHFLTFHALAERILGEGPVPEDRIVREPTLYHEVINQLLQGTSEIPFVSREKLLKPGMPIPRGLAPALSATLKDLQDSGAKVVDLAKAAQEGHLGEETDQAIPILELNVLIYDILRKHGLRTHADFLRRAAERLPASHWFKSQKSVFLYGFYDLTGVQLDLVLSLANHPDARIYFPYEMGNPAYAFAEKLLKDPAFESKCKPTSSSPAAAGRGTMDSPPETAGNDGNRAFVDVWSCSGARDEVWLTAKEILKLADEGMAFHEIGIVARSLDPYLSVLREIFSTHQIPYTASKENPAGSHPQVKAFRSMLREQGEDNPTLSAIWSDHAHWAAAIMRGREPLLEAIRDQLKSLETLDALGKPVCRHHFITVLERKLDALKLPSNVKRTAGVQVLEVQQARGLSFKALFVLGLNEKSFPRLIREDAFLSDNARSALAQATGCRLSRKLDGYQEERLLFALMQEAAKDHLYWLYQRSDEEGKALIPSVYVQEHLRATGQEPRRVPRALPEKFRNRAAPAFTPKELSVWINRADHSAEPLIKALGWNLPEFSRLLKAQRARESFKPGILAQDGLISDISLLKSLLAMGYSPSGLEDLAECPFQFFAGHVLRIPVEEELAPGGEITPQALGTLFHRTLELFYIRCTKEGFPETPDATLKRLEQACRETFGEIPVSENAAFPLSIRASINTVIKSLSQFLLSDFEEFKESGFTPAFFEKDLEGKSKALGGQAFRGRADRIDIRQEAGKTVARVVDYKSGKPSDKAGKLETALIRGKFLQLPLYMTLAEEFLHTHGYPGARVETSELRWLRDAGGDQESPSLSDSFWKSPSFKTFAENIAGLTVLAENGHFYIEPSTGDWGYCGRCYFARICRKEHMPTRSRAAGDPQRIANRERLSRTAS